MKKITPAKWKKKLDIQWSKIIRSRDMICQKCGKAPASQAAHIVSRGNLETRWELNNGYGMCYYCHIIWAHREPVEFVDWVESKMGKMNFMKLKEKSHKIHPWGTAEFQEKLAELEHEAFKLGF